MRRRQQRQPQARGRRCVLDQVDSIVCLGDSNSPYIYRLTPLRTNTMQVQALAVHPVRPWIATGDEVCASVGMCIWMTTVDLNLRGCYPPTQYSTTWWRCGTSSGGRSCRASPPRSCGSSNWSARGSSRCVPMLAVIAVVRCVPLQFKSFDPFTRTRPWHRARALRRPSRRSSRSSS